MKQIVTITGENLNIVTNNVEATAATGKKTKAQMRLEALKAAGVDTSNISLSVTTSLSKSKMVQQFLLIWTMQPSMR